MRKAKFDFYGGINENAKGDGRYAVSSEGFYIDSAGSLVKGEGFEEYITAPGIVTGMWAGVISDKRIIAYVAGNRFYYYNLDTSAITDAGYTGGGDTAMFYFGGYLYLLGSSGYYRFDGTSLESVEGYIPLVAVSTLPDGSGTPYESVNMLTPKRRQKFSCDGTSQLFRLAEKGISAVVSVYINGVFTSPDDYAVNTSAGTVEFLSPPEEGLNNMEITYAMADSFRSTVLGCKHALLFGSNADERVFIWGNSLYPNCRYHTDLADGVPSAEYFPVTGYTYIGNSPIIDIVQQYDRQLIFTKNTAYLSYCETRTSLSGQTYLSFPVYPLSGTKGSLICCNGASVEGMPVSVCDDGINVWQATLVESYKNAVCISDPIKNELLNHIHNNNTRIAVFSDVAGGRLFLGLPDTLFVYDMKLKCWYKFRGITPLHFCLAFGKVFMSTALGKIYRLSRSGIEHNASYTTHYCDLGLRGLGSIKDVVLTLTAGDNTKGSITAEYTDGRRKCRRKQDFSVPVNLSGKTVKLKIPLSIYYTDGVAFTFSSPEGRDLILHSYEVTYKEKGELPDGI